MSTALPLPYGKNLRTGFNLVRSLRRIPASENDTRPLDPFAGRIVEQDRVAVRLPDGDQLDAPGTMDAEVDAAGTAAPNNVSFRQIPASGTS